MNKLEEKIKFAKNLKEESHSRFENLTNFTYGLGIFRFFSHIYNLN
jgi:hypothetical protein